MNELLEELALNAWPSVRQVHFDHWVLRLSGNHTRRANSVNFLGPSTLPLDFKIDFCEEAYSRFNTSPVFKFAGLYDSSTIDSNLANRGYHIEGDAMVMTHDLAQLRAVPSVDYRVESDLSAAWFDLAAEMLEIDPGRLPYFEKILSNIVPDHGFASVWHDGKPAAIGLAVVERGWIGLYDIVTSTHYRRIGLGNQLVLNMMNWGKERGATAAYLQVVETNTPAVSLYSKIGYTPLYRYWYRAKTG